MTNSPPDQYLGHQPPRKSPVGWIAGGLAIVLLVIGGAVAAIVLTKGGEPSDSAGKEEPSGTSSEADNSPGRSPTDVVKAFIGALEDHDRDGAAEYVCDDKEKELLGSGGQTGELWEFFDKAEFEFGDEKVLDNANAEVGMTADTPDGTNEYTVKLKTVNGAWQVCDMVNET